MPDEIKEPEAPKCYSIKEYILFKLDRNISILGLVALGCWAMQIGTKESMQIAIVVAGGLVAYIGSRGSK